MYEREWKARLREEGLGALERLGALNRLVSMVVGRGASAEVDSLFRDVAYRLGEAERQVSVALGSVGVGARVRSLAIGRGLRRIVKKVGK